MQEEQLIRELAKSYELPIKEGNSELNRLWLAERINELLNHDFSRLISILYRVDVSEARLRNMLKQHPATDAGLIIADLLVQRQVEKEKSRQQFRAENQTPDENEKW